MVAIETDVVVLGVGTSGEDLCLRLLDAGVDVVGVEANLLGGECPYWACIPSKMMIRAAHLLAEARRIDGVAGQVTVEPDWSPVAARVREQATGGWDDGVAVSRFGAAGGTFLRGRGRFTGPDTVVVGDDEITAHRGVVVATGSLPAVPPIPGLADIAYWSTHELIACQELPASLLVLGGGAVGCELSQVMARFGVDVTIVEGQDRLLAAEEPEAGATVEAALTADGVTVRTGARVTEAEERDGRLTLTLDDGTVLAAERLLVATGRRLDPSDLGLEHTAAEVTAGGAIVTDDRLRAAPGIWAMGDVTGQAMFTHMALHQGAVIAADLLGQDPPPAADLIPRVTFTDPEVGAAGLTEEVARAAGLDIVVSVKAVGATFRGWLHGPGADGVLKLVVDRATGRLVGALSVGPRGGEVLGALMVAMVGEVPLASLRNSVFPFPTFYGGIGEMIGAYGRGLEQVIEPGFEPLLDP